MDGDRDFQRALEDGRKNQEVKTLLQNWCGHARIEKFGGVGLIEAQTGFPIGHHSVACDHAPMAGSATWLLEDAALDFYDRNCKACKVRLPLRLPNLLKLVDRRDRDAAKAAAELEREKEQQRQAFEIRQKTRQALRSESSPSEIALLDDLQQLDVTRSEIHAAKIIETARLAPEAFGTKIIEYLYSLVEADERWAKEVSLACLQIVSTDHARLAACAMSCLANYSAVPVAANILLDQIDEVVATSVEASIKCLCLFAAPPRDTFRYSEPERHPAALQLLATRFPAQAEKTLDKLLISNAAEEVQIAARVLPLVYPVRIYPISILRSLATKITRVDSLVDSDRDSEIRDVVHELEACLVHAMLVDHKQTDEMLIQYFQGASTAGEARIVGVYSSLLRLPNSRSKEITQITNYAPYKTALHRILVLASNTKNIEVIHEILEALRHVPEQLTSLGANEIDFLLGTAALIDQSLTAFTESRRAAENTETFYAHLERENHRDSLLNLRAATLKFASHAASSDPQAAAKFTAFLSSNDRWSEGFHCALVQALPPLMTTGALTNAVLPFLYRAMIGESVFVRMAAARAIGEMGTCRVRELPSLVHDAFLLLLADPIIGLHQSATRALERVSLPPEYDKRVYRLLEGLFVAYYQDRGQDEFLVTCIERLLHQHEKQDLKDSKLKRIVVAVLMKVDDGTLLNHSGSWLLRELVDVEGFYDLVMRLIRSSKRSEYKDDEMIFLLRHLPKESMLEIQAELVAWCKDHTTDRSIVAAVIETLTTLGSWNMAAKIAGYVHTATPETTQMRVRKMHLKMAFLAAEFESLLANGHTDEALTCMTDWRNLIKELNLERTNG